MKIATSILNSQDRVEDVLKLNETNNSYIHIDVMDGEFVSQVQFQNIEEIYRINCVSKYPLDIHLMIKNPIPYIEQLRNMNIEFITVHLEIEENIHEIIEKIHKLGYRVGISLKPNTDIKKIEKYLEEIDMILIMSVEPGLGGQKFIESTLGRIQELKELICKTDRNILIEVDGGINDKTIQKLENVDIAVVGSYIIKSDNYFKQIENLLRVVNFFDISS